MRILLISELLLLLIVANGTPVVLSLLLGQRFNQALDAGRLFPDRRPWFGASKTFRGLFAAVSASILCAPLVGFSWLQGALFGGLAMLGDLLSSFTKRRLGFVSSCSQPVLDQLPETLLPLLIMQPVHQASVPEMAMVICAFTVIDLLLSKIINPDQATCR